MICYCLNSANWCHVFILTYIALTVHNLFQVTWWQAGAQPQPLILPSPSLTLSLELALLSQSLKQCLKSELLPIVLSTVKFNHIQTLASVQLVKYPSGSEVFLDRFNYKQENELQNQHFIFSQQRFWRYKSTDVLLFYGWVVPETSGPLPQYNYVTSHKTESLRPT